MARLCLLVIPVQLHPILKEAEGSQPAGAALLIFTAEDPKPLVAISKLVGLDTEAEVSGHPVELAALRHHVHVGLVHICHVLQVPRILRGALGGVIEARSAQEAEKAFPKLPS